MATRLRVLLVDDNPDDRALVARELRGEYGDVVISEVIDRPQLERALEGAYDLVITDYQLRWTDGLTVLREVKDRSPHVPTVMFTGTGDEETAVQAMKDGLDEYVIKSPQHFRRLGTATRRAIERAAHRRERSRMVSILEATPDFVGTADAEGRILYVNGSGRGMLGIPSEEDLSGTSIATLHPAWAAALLTAEALPRAAREGSWRGDSSLLARDGTEIEVSQVVIGHHASDGSVEYFSTIARDMTRERSLQEQLRRAQKVEAVGRLAGGVAHDFNNLLTVIMGEADFAEQKAETPELRSALSEIRRAGERAVGITSQLLSFARPRPAEPTVFVLDALVQDMERLLRRLVGEDVQFVMRGAGQVSAVRADRGQLEQVLANLVINARDAMPEGGLLVIESADVMLSGEDAQIHGDVEPGRYAMLAVADSGTGMSAEVKAHLFEPFFTTKGVGEGTGLGLATSYAIVKQHRGHIGVYSEVGRGTTMKLYLPRVEPRVDSSLAAAPEAGVLMGSGAILVVEDDDALRRVTARMLKALGYRVETASDAEGALRLLAEPDRATDLLLTDVVLPNADGLELAAGARELRPGLKVLFMSGYTEDFVTRRAGGQAIHVLPKPFEIGELSRKLRGLLADASD
ncbi:MAG TPA: response regulator [Longimicrobiales bacterium]|nr:response regulator [Longimicrobiales bacterium]